MGDTTSFLDTSMQQMGIEFPECLKVSQEYRIQVTDKQTGHSEIKPITVTLIQNFQQNYQHSAFITEELAEEAFALPQCILRAIDELPKHVFVSSGHAFISRTENDNRALVFSRAVYGYCRKLKIDESKIADAFRNCNLKLFLRDERYWNEFRESRKPDAFICHDSRDKDSFVRELAKALGKRLIKVWYDEYALDVGDSLISKIDEGLRHCQYGVIIISRNFLTRKKWSNREFRSLAHRELNEDRKVILPVWLGVSRDEVAEYSIDLADKVALSAARGIEAVADEIAAEVRKSRQ